MSCWKCRHCSEGVVHISIPPHNHHETLLKISSDLHERTKVMDNPLTQPCIELLEVCSLNNQCSVSKAQHHLHFLGSILPPPILSTFYRGTMKSTLSYSWTSGFWGQLRGSSAAIVAHPSSRPSCGLSPTCRLQVGWRSWIIWATSNTLCNSFSPQAVTAASSTLWCWST